MRWRLKMKWWCCQVEDEEKENENEAIKDYEG